jgi:hypothetical protein
MEDAAKVTYTLRKKNYGSRWKDGIAGQQFQHFTNAK